MDENLVKEAGEILKNIIYLTLGSVGEDGIPWVSPLFYAYDEQLRFYWVSPKDCRHAGNLNFSQNASWVVFDTSAPKWEGKGVYFEGKCIELKEKGEIESGLKLIFDRLGEMVPEAENYIGVNPYRVFMGIADKMWITHDKNENGKIIDARREI